MVTTKLCFPFFLIGVFFLFVSSLSAGDTRVDGLTGTECNSKNIAGGGECVAKASSSLCGKGAAAGAANDAGIICVNDEALDNCAYDPNHAHAPTTERIFGCKYEATNSPNGTTPCSAHASTNGNPTMTGFSQSAIWEGRDGLNEMSMWYVARSLSLSRARARSFSLFVCPCGTSPQLLASLQSGCQGVTTTRQDLHSSRSCTCNCHIVL